MPIKPVSSVNFVLIKQGDSDGNKSSKSQRINLKNRFGKYVHSFKPKRFLSIDPNHTLQKSTEHQILDVEALGKMFDFKRSMRDYQMLVENKKKETVSTESTSIKQQTKTPKITRNDLDIDEIIIEEVEIPEDFLVDVKTDIYGTIVKAIEKNLGSLQSEIPPRVLKPNTQAQTYDKPLNPKLPSQVAIPDSLQESIVDKISKQLEAVTVQRSGFWKKSFVSLLGIFVVLSIIMNIYLVANNPNLVENFASQVVQEETRVEEKLNPGSLAITRFSSENSIVDVGQKIELSKTTLSTDNSSNCQTSIPVPEKNGCNFTLAMNLTGIPKEGVYYTSIQIFADMGSESQISLDLKSFETGKIINRLAIIDQAKLKKKITLPSDFLGSQGIFFNLWDKDKESIDIEEIRFNYFYVENLSEVVGKIKGISTAQEANIYWDKNENSRLDLQVDKLWTCSSEFPGVETVQINEDGEFSIIRSDTCYEEIDVTTILNDEGQKSLPAGDWLMKLSDGTVIPFETKPGETKNVLELSIPQ